MTRHFLVTTLGSYGDVYPKVAIARRLQDRGHKVTLLTNPFFEKLAQHYDLDFVPIGTLEQYRAFASHPDLFHPRRSLRVIFDNLVLPNIRPAYDALARLVEPDNTVIVTSILVFGARLVQEVHGVPAVTIHIMPSAFKSAHELPRNGMFNLPNWLPVGLKRLYWHVADLKVVDPVIAPALNAVRADLGLVPVAHIMTRWGHSPDGVIGLFPPWFASAQPDWPANSRQTGFLMFLEGQEQPLSPDVRDFLDAGEPPLVFMPGSLMREGTQFFRTAVEACQQLNKRAILLSRYAGHIPPALPEDIRHFDYVPLNSILPRAAGLVHHGGIGTLAQALRAGTPQLVHPMAYDQYDNAARLKALGVGDWIAPRRWTMAHVMRKLDKLLNTMQVQQACQRVAQRFEGSDPLGDTCDAIEAMGRDSA